jgi:hypothetical protein
VIVLVQHLLMFDYLFGFRMAMARYLIRPSLSSYMSFGSRAAALCMDVRLA